MTLSFFYLMTQSPVRGLIVFSRGAMQNNLTPSQVQDDFLVLGRALIHILSIIIIVTTATTTIIIKILFIYSFIFIFYVFIFFMLGRVKVLLLFIEVGMGIDKTISRVWL